METFPTGATNSYKKITPFLVNLNRALDEGYVYACDVEWFTIWDSANNEHFTRIQIPQDIFVRYFVVYICMCVHVIYPLLQILL